MTLGKGIGGGVPLAKEEVCCFVPGDQGGTYNGNPLMAAAGCAVLEELLKPGFMEHVLAMGQHLAFDISDNGSSYEAFCRLAVNDLIVNPNVAMLGFTMEPFTPTYVLGLWQEKEKAL